eukprot:7631768-Pyramimonas_sp.AAC.1
MPKASCTESKQQRPSTTPRKASTPRETERRPQDTCRTGPSLSSSRRNPAHRTPPANLHHSCPLRRRTLTGAATTREKRRNCASPRP